MARDLKDSLRDRHRQQAGGGDPFHKALTFDAPERVRAAGLYPFFHPIDANDGPEAFVGGKKVLMFGSNNYLGLTTRDEVRSAAARAVEQYGTSLTGSRLLNGTLALHRSLEERLARFLGREACLVFSTGYQASLGTLQALAGRETVVALDHRSHASLFDATRMADADTYSFRHGDTEHLDRVLRGAHAPGGKLVVLEGVFSMEGEVVRLEAMLEVAARHRARVLLDDAHGLGVLGPGGRGTAHHFGLADRVDLLMGTFSKSLASVGGFLAGPAPVIEYVQHFARSFIFTAALPPASLAAADAALQVLEREPELVTTLAERVRQYRQALRDEGIEVSDEPTPIVPIVLGDEERTMQVWRELLDNGLYVNAAIAPAVPRNGALLRTSVMATHSPSQVASAAAIIGAVVRRSAP